jgi:hypothetical protein
MRQQRTFRMPAQTGHSKGVAPRFAHPRLAAHERLRHCLDYSPWDEHVMWPNLRAPASGNDLLALPDCLRAMAEFMRRGPRLCRRRHGNEKRGLPPEAAHKVHDADSPVVEDDSPRSRSSRPTATTSCGACAPEAESKFRRLDRQLLGSVAPHLARQAGVPLTKLTRTARPSLRVVEAARVLGTTFDFELEPLRDDAC